MIEETTDRPAYDPTAEDAPPDTAERAPDAQSDAPSDADGAMDAMRRVDPEGAERLRTEWGADFAANLAHARHAAATVADPALVAALEETGLGNDPRVLRAAARIGALLQGGGGTAAPQGKARDALERELDRLVGSPDYWSDRVQRRVRQIHLSLHGGATLPVHRMARDAGGVR